LALQTMKVERYRSGLRRKQWKSWKWTDCTFSIILTRQPTKDDWKVDWFSQAMSWVAIVNWFDHWFGTICSWLCSIVLVSRGFWMFWCTTIWISIILLVHKLRFCLWT
jgi:hypothetical protein